MAQVVVMPQAGNTVESCIVVTWHVNVGDQVDTNTILCEVETDKSLVDVQSGFSGTVLAILCKEGDEVPVKLPIAVIGEPNEDLEKALKELGIDGSNDINNTTADSNPSASDMIAKEGQEDNIENSTNKSSKPDADSQLSTSPANTNGTPGAPASPRARGVAAQNHIDLDPLLGTGPNGRIIERDVLNALSSRPQATQAAKATGQYQLDNNITAGTGIGGRVTRADISSGNNALAKVNSSNIEDAAANTSVSSSKGNWDYPGTTSQTQLKGIRKIVSERMMASLTNSAQITLTISARAEKLLNLRKRFKNSNPELGFSNITIGDLICFATAKTLTKHTVLNAHLNGEVITEFEQVHLGIAVDTPRGLLVPTVRHASLYSLREFAQASKNVISQSLEGKIDPELLSGATFTVSNLGAFGIESFTPLINLPQTGILGVNAIVDSPCKNADGSISLEKKIRLSLTIDHRVVDGADAARFLVDLKAAIEDIDLTAMN